VAVDADAAQQPPFRGTAFGAPQRIWREQVVVRAAELAGLATWISALHRASSDAELRAIDAARDDEMRARLQSACEAAADTSRWPPHSRARMERAVGNLDAAEAVLLSRSPDAYLHGQLEAIRAHVAAHLPPKHPQRVQTEDLIERYVVPAVPATECTPINGEDRETLVEAARTASWAARREQVRLRSFRTAVVVTAVGLLLLASALVVAGASQPRWIPLCFAPQGMDTVVCPTSSAPTGGSDEDPASTAEVEEAIRDTARGADIAVVMLVGLAGAAVTSAAALRRLRGTSTPFAVPIALLLLKLPVGALTAFLGLVLLHGEFVPGLSALDSSGQILAWALIFGAAQQLVTGLVDKKAQAVLDSVGSAPMTADKE
jgi:hypothetical protein